MLFKQFQSGIYETLIGSAINRQTLCFNNTITETVDKRVFVNNKLSDFTKLEEAIEHIKCQKLQENIHHEIQQDLYKEIPDNFIVDIIHEHYPNVRITDTLVESYTELAASKQFTTDIVAQKIRQFNKFDQLIENYVDFKLDDGSIIVISEETQEHINNILKEHQDIIKHMRTNQENFLNVLNQIEE